MIMIIQMVSFDIINIERVKKIIASQFGLLMGLERSPEIKTARRKLAVAVESLDTENISKGRFQKLMKKWGNGHLPRPKKETGP